LHIRVRTGNLRAVWAASRPCNVQGASMHTARAAQGLRAISAGVDTPCQGGSKAARAACRRCPVPVQLIAAGGVVSKEKGDKQKMYACWQRAANRETRHRGWRQPLLLSPGRQVSHRQVSLKHGLLPSHLLPLIALVPSASGTRAATESGTAQPQNSRGVSTSSPGV